MTSPDVILELRDVVLSFGRGLTSTRVLDGVSIAIERGHTVGLVGESGSGKSTIAKAVVGIHRVDSGEIAFDGLELTRASRKQRRHVQRRIQLIPQDPYSSLDPLRTIGQTLAEARDPKRASVKTHRGAIVEALAAVGLGEDALERYPHEFSGGQRQRIAIARALMVQPEIIVADEITSALDVSTQAEILKLLAKLKTELNLTVVFISHNLAVVREICDEIVVLLHGQVVEHGSVDQVFSAPKAEYTRTLIDSVPGGASFSLQWQ